MILPSGYSFNIAMENGPFIDGLPIKNGDFPWLCITRWYIPILDGGLHRRPCKKTYRRHSPAMKFHPVMFTVNICMTMFFFS